MRHRHIEVDPATPVGELGRATIDSLLERGDLDDWRPILREIDRDPWGDVAERVLGLVESHPMYGTSRLWRSWILERRSGASGLHAGETLRRLRLARGRTQREVAERLGMTQPEVSKLERRRGVRLSTVQAYIAALGGSLQLTARFGDEQVPLD